MPRCSENIKIEYMYRVVSAQSAVYGRCFGTFGGKSSSDPSFGVSTPNLVLDVRMAFGEPLVVAAQDACYPACRGAGAGLGASLTENRTKSVSSGY